MKFLTIFIFLISSALANEISDLKNVVINKELKKYDDLTFLDVEEKQLNLKDYRGNLILLNFWTLQIQNYIYTIPQETKFYVQTVLLT